MKKNVVVCGLIAGVLSVVWFIWSTAVGQSEHDFEKGMIYGYVSMILAFSLIFVAIKNFRDKYNNGVITFGKAFKIGLFITLIASTIYVLVWLIEYYFFIPDFFEKYTEFVVNQMRKEGASQVMIDAKAAECANLSRLCQNPFFNAMLTYTEILPVGLFITLIAAFILKRKNNLQTVENK